MNQPLEAIESVRRFPRFGNSNSDRLFLVETMGRQVLKCFKDDGNVSIPMKKHTNKFLLNIGNEYMSIYLDVFIRKYYL